MGYAVVNTSTGEVVADEKDGIRFTTAEGREKATKAIKKKEIKEAMKLCRDDEFGKFIFMVYRIGEEINRHEEILTQPDLTKLVYISTYLGYDGFLVTDNHRAMSKDLLNKKLGISKNVFNKLYDKLINVDILQEKNGAIHINKKYFVKGKLKDVPSKYTATRIYIDGIRELYDKISVRQHRQLGFLFRLIPYLNIEYNIVCYNPYEKDLQCIEPMPLKDIAERLGYSDDHLNRVTNELLKLKTVNGKGVIGMAFNKDDRRSYKVYVNPAVIYKGENYKAVEVLEKLAD